MTEEFSEERMDNMFRQAREHVELNRRLMVAGLEDMRNAPADMEAAEKLQDRLTRAYNALDAIRRLPCQTRPEAAEEMEATRGYRSPCDGPECASCLAFLALVKEGRLPA